MYVLIWVFLIKSESESKIPFYPLAVNRAHDPKTQFLGGNLLLPLKSDSFSTTTTKLQIFIKKRTKKKEQIELLHCYSTVPQISFFFFFAPPLC